MAALYRHRVFIVMYRRLFAVIVAGLLIIGCWLHYEAFSSVGEDPCEWAKATKADQADEICKRLAASVDRQPS